MSPRIAKKSDRQRQLMDAIAKNPFVTDEDLAEELRVSIPTIRLDRQELSVPEVRRRIREMASHFFGVSKSLASAEIVGEVIEIEPGKRGISVLETDQSMCLKRCNIIRGHVIFAQANTLANAVVDAEVAVTGKAELDFLRPARAGNKLIAKARVAEHKGHRSVIDVVIRSRDEIVCRGRFIVHDMTMPMAKYLKLLKDE